MEKVSLLLIIVTIHATGAAETAIQTCNDLINNVANSGPNSSGNLTSFAEEKMIDILNQINTFNCSKKIPETILGKMGFVVCGISPKNVAHWGASIEKFCFKFFGNIGNKITPQNFCNYGCAFGIHVKTGKVVIACAFRDRTSEIDCSDD